MSAGSAGLALAGGASAPLAIGATVIASCNLSAAETMPNQANFAQLAASVNLLCSQAITLMVHVSGSSLDRSASALGAPSHENKQPSSLTTTEGIYSGNLTITVNF